MWPRASCPTSLSSLSPSVRWGDGETSTGVVERGLTLPASRPSLFLSTPPFWLLWPLDSSQTGQLLALLTASHMLFPTPENRSSREPRVFPSPPHPSSLCFNVTFLKRLLLILLAKPASAIKKKKIQPKEYSQWYGNSLCGDRWHDTCGEHSRTYRFVKSQCRTPETHVTSCVGYMSIKKRSGKKKKRKEKPCTITLCPLGLFIFLPPAPSPALLPSP